MTRGLSRVKLVTSDARAALVAAIGATLPVVTWKRCRTHCEADLKSVTPQSSWRWFKALLGSIYDKSNTEPVHDEFERVLDAPAGKLPEVADHLEAVLAEILAFTAAIRLVGTVLAAQHDE